MKKGFRFSLLPAAIAFAAFFIVVPTSGAAKTVHIKTLGPGWSFTPAAAGVHDGDRVAFINDTPITHTATSKFWDTGDIQPGQTKFVTIHGTADYACRYHGQSPGMSGEITLR